MACPSHRRLRPTPLQAPVLLALLPHFAASFSPSHTDGGPRPHEQGLLRREAEQPALQPDLSSLRDLISDASGRQGRHAASQEHVSIEVLGSGKPVLLDRYGLGDADTGSEEAQEVPEVDGFRIGDQVTWLGSDWRIPRGDVGTVIQVFPESSRVGVDFPLGRFAFSTRFLRHAPAERVPEWDLPRRPGQPVAQVPPVVASGAPLPRALPGDTQDNITDTGQAVPVPNLNSPEHLFPAEDSADHERAVKRCGLRLVQVIICAIVAGSIGYIYLLKVLPDAEPKQEGEGTNDSAAANAGGGAASGVDEGAQAAATGVYPNIPARPSTASVEPLLKKAAEEAAEGTEEEEGKKLSNKVRYSYCLPTVSTLPVCAVIAVFVIALYSQRGASLPILAMAQAVARSFDVVSDPVMSYLTDSCRHKAGRRRPWMIVGAPLYAVFLVALFSPPFMTPSLMALWFAFTYIAFFLTNTLANIPYDAWGPELTEDSNERSRLFFLSGMFDGGGTLFAFALPFIAFTISQRSGVTKDICIPKQEMVSRCARGFHCGAFNANGRGYEFVENATFTHSSLELYMPELLNYDCDLASPAIIAGSALEGDAIQTFCSCMTTCGQACAGANRSWAYLFTGLFFAAWYWLTSYNCCHVVKERKAPPGGRPKARPLVPSMLGTMQNPAFAVLLPAWACDAVGTAVFMALCPYLVLYIVAPEFQTLNDSPFGIDCKEGARGISTSDNYHKLCNSMNILGGCVGAALLCAIVTTPIWLAAVKKFGKVRMWLLWSLLMASTNYLFVTLNKSWIRLSVLVCGLNGIPIAAKFLADAILADIIDYDEFLTGTRNEATYTMFKSFLPKVMAIPASALPLSIMNAAGHIPAENGKVMFQPTAVQWSIKIMAGLISGTISLLAWYIKTKYPLKTDAILEEMAKGIALHKEGKAAKDPLSDHEYSIITFTEEENMAGVWSLDHFPGVKLIEDIKADPGSALEALARKANMHFMGATLFLVAIVGCLVASLKLLMNRQLSFVPTVMAVFMGVAFVTLGFTYCRRKAAYELKEKPPPPELVEKVLQQRQGLQALYDAQKESAKSKGKGKNDEEATEGNEHPDSHLSAAGHGADEDGGQPPSL